MDVLHALMRARPFASVVTLGSTGLSANHIPLLLDADPQPYGTLRGHFARSNPQWRDFSPETAALVIFNGPDHYISPSWYPSKQEHGRVVPTWNFVAVHAYGTLRIHDDREWVRNLVIQLTETHEAEFEQPWHVTDAPEDYIDGMLKAIVGIEIRIDRLEGKWKLGQNRNTADRLGAAEGLAKKESPSAAQVSELMAKIPGGQA